MVPSPQATLRNLLIRLATTAVIGLLVPLSLAAEPAQRPDVPTFEPVDLPGLSHESVAAIVQDAQGFIWFGTWDGLDRWDGRRVTNHASIPGNIDSLWNSTISALLVDHQGNLWAATLDGINRYDPNRQEFERFALPLAGDQEPAPTLRWSLYQTSDRTIWAGTANGLFALYPGSDHFEPIGDTKIPLESSGIVDIREDSQGTLWIMTSGWPLSTAALYRLDRHGSGPDDIEISRHEVAIQQAVAFFIDRDDRFWVGGTVASKPSADGAGFQPLQQDDQQKPAAAYLQDSSGRVWIGSYEGLYLSEPGEDHGVPVPLGHRSGFLDDYVLSIFEDKAHTIWVSTIAGVFRHDPARKAFSTLQEDPGNPRFGLSTNRVASIVEDISGDLWVGTWGAGVDRVDARTGEIRNYSPALSTPGALPPTQAYFLHQDATDRLWVAAGEQLCNYQAAEDNFACWTLNGDIFWSLAEGSDGLLFLASRASGLLRFDPETGQFRRLLEERAETRSVQSLEVAGTCLWTVNLEGLLIRHDLASGNTDVFDVTLSPGSSPGTIHGFYDLHQDPSGILWIGTSSGLASFDPQSGTSRFFTKDDGLPGSYIYAILDDQQGRLWLSTNRGIVRFDHHRENGRRFRAFNRTDGVGSMEFNRRARFRARDGRLFFGGKEGITWFHPEAIADNPQAPSLALAGVTVTDRDGIERRITDTRSGLRLEPDDHLVSLQLAALSFTDPANNRFRYRLDGFDSAWVEADTRNLATYTALPAGTYEFQFQGSNNDGVWNQAGLSIPMVVAPPFWETAWFRVLALLILLAALTLVYRWRVARLIEIERLRMRIAGDLHDDLSSDLSGIALTMDILEQRGNLDQRDRRRVTQVRQTAIDMIEGVRDLVWYLDTGHDSVNALWRRMHRVADSLLSGREVTMSTDDALQSVEIDMTLRRQVFLIFKELIHNIARHSEARRVWVGLHGKEGQLVLRVRDDGVGFDPTAASNGHGIHNLKRRAAEMAGKLEIESLANQGTQTTITVPMNHSPRPHAN